MASPSNIRIIDVFIDNAKDVVKLLELHHEKNPPKSTYHSHEVLIKSAIVLLVACWEAFIEDAAERSVEFLIANSQNPNDLPKALLKHIAKELKDHKNELQVWGLAGDGWKAIVRDHKAGMLQKYLGTFNTPKAGNIDELFRTILGIDSISTCWSWKGMSNRNIKHKLGELIYLRGAIAHRAQADEKVSRSLANAYGILLARMAIKTSNSLRTYLHDQTGKYPWSEVSHRSVR